MSGFVRLGQVSSGYFRVSCKLRISPVISGEFRLSHYQVMSG
jgi:hypothetical protein